MPEHAVDETPAHWRQAMGLEDGQLRDLVVQTRALIKELFPEADEIFKYGGIQFALGQPFCGIYAYTRHVSVELSHGAKIAGPSLDLEGKGQCRRHIKLYAVEDIRSKQLAHYLPLALQAAQASA